MKKRNLIAIGIITALLLTGCQSGTANTNENTQQPAAAQEQQVTSIQPETTGGETSTQPEATEAENTAQSENANAANTTQPDQTSAETPASYTLEDLTALVSTYEGKADAAAPGGTDADLETFFSLKQEGNQIDDALDFYEDDLEAQYRAGTLTREEYKKQERELEKLEDRLDDAEDRLEITFGIDD